MFDEDAMDEKDLIDFKSFIKKHQEILKMPSLVSFLYDINRLPEVILTFESKKMAEDFYHIITHFKWFKEDIEASISVG